MFQGDLIYYPEMPVLAVRAKSWGAWLDTTPDVYRKRWFADVKFRAAQNDHNYDLVESLKRDGQREPILVEPQPYRLNRPNYFYVEPGGSRWPAMVYLGWETCKAMLMWKSEFAELINERFSHLKQEKHTIESAKQFFGEHSPTYQRILEKWQYGQE